MDGGTFDFSAIDEDDMFFQNVNKDWLAALDPTNHAALIDWYNKVASTPNGVERMQGASSRALAAS